MNQKAVKEILRVLRKHRGLKRAFENEATPLKCMTRCNANCCKYVILDVSGADRDYYRYLLYQGLNLMYDPRDRSVSVHMATWCKHLTSKNRCDVYSKRPAICREFQPFNCLRKGEKNPFQRITERNLSRLKLRRSHGNKSKE